MQKMVPHNPVTNTLSLFLELFQLLKKGRNRQIVESAYFSKYSADTFIQWNGLFNNLHKKKKQVKQLFLSQIKPQVNRLLRSTGLNKIHKKWGRVRVTIRQIKWTLIHRERSEEIIGIGRRYES